MKALKQDIKGVSPVIATILLVSITVVLSATLYAMVGDIRGETEPPEPISGIVRETSDGYLVEITRGSTTYSAEKIGLYNKTTGVAYFGSENGEITITVDEGEVSIVFNDNDNNGEINCGDSFKIQENEAVDLSNYEFRISDTSFQRDIE